MATGKEYLTFILDQLSDLNEITSRSMMGEYIIYYQGKIAAYICDDHLLVKPVEAAKALMPDAAMEAPYEGAKEMLLVEQVDDKAFLTELFHAIIDQLPAQNFKKKK